MDDTNLRGPWPRPTVQTLDGRFVRVARCAGDTDIAELYDASHRSEEFRAPWRYLWNGPFASQAEMHNWLRSIEQSADPLFFTITSRELERKVGMFSLMNIVPEMGRLEFGHIWYSPLAQKTKVNTEVTYLFLRHVFDELHYRRVEWKCDNRNEPSKRAALRMGFKFEGMFRKHMVVKGQNRDTAWYAMVDDEWPPLRANFEKYLASDHLSLTLLNQLPAV